KLESRRKSDHLDSLQAGDLVELYFRPGNVILSHKKNKNSLKADIDYLNYQGNTTQYSLHIGSSNIRAVIPGKPVDGDSGQIYLSIAPDKLIVEKKE
ncbi:MAG: hypothetical protein L3J12_09615, partial [Spirochaetales bacterium]|nr:hypothetical protein [Spirochaetales bacterium]